MELKQFYFWFLIKPSWTIMIHGGFLGMNWYQIDVKKMVFVPYKDSIEIKGYKNTKKTINAMRMQLILFSFLFSSYFFIKYKTWFFAKGVFTFDNRWFKAMYCFLSDRLEENILFNSFVTNSFSWYCSLLKIVSFMICYPVINFIP